MYKTIDDQAQINAFIETLKPKMKDGCVSYRLGILATLIFFHNPGPEGGYIIMSARVGEGNKMQHAIDITDEPSVMKAIVRRESNGERTIMDEELDKLLSFMTGIKK
jgi:hypothetical protein